MVHVEPNSSVSSSKCSVNSACHFLQPTNGSSFICNKLVPRIFLFPNFTSFMSLHLQGTESVEDLPVSLHLQRRRVQRTCQSASIYREGEYRGAAGKPPSIEKESVEYLQVNLLQSGHIVCNAAKEKASNSRGDANAHEKHLLVLLILESFLYVVHLQVKERNHAE